MSDLKVSISTRQASHLLGVHESSVKRWCNAEELACWHTPGGHRRIPITAVVDFAEEQDLRLKLDKAKLAFKRVAHKMPVKVKLIRRLPTT